MYEPVGIWVDCIIPIVVSAACIIGGFAVVLGFVS